MIANVLQIAGALCVSAAAFTVALPLGLLVLGLCALLFGLALER